MNPEAERQGRDPGECDLFFSCHLIIWSHSLDQFVNTVRASVFELPRRSDTWAWHADVSNSSGEKYGASEMWHSI